MRRYSKNHPHADWHNDQEHFVYRCFDGDGVLLYIGFTWDLRTRLAAHKAPGALLGQLMKSVTTQSFPTRSAARDAERLAIQAERPVLNVQHNRAGCVA